MREPTSPSPRDAVPSRRLQLALLAVAGVTAAALYLDVAGRSVHAAAVASPAHSASRSASPPLPRGGPARAPADEFSAIRPADLDATVPPIPPSETWPSQR